MKKLVIFDLDGTLAKSKSPIDAEMGMLLCTLLGITKVAVISGGDLPQFQQQILAHLPAEANLRQLSLLPTCGTRFFQYTDDWHNLYSEDLSEAQKQNITAALKKSSGGGGL